MSSPPLSPLTSTLALMSDRRNVAPRRLVDPGPSEAQVAQLFETAAMAPDHGQLLPWRFVVVPIAKRALLGDAFAAALTKRDAEASAEQLDTAREKAHRAPLLVLAIVRLAAADPVDSPATAAEITDLERVVSLGCAIQNILLAAQGMGFASGLTSGKAMDSAPMRRLFSLVPGEQAVCFINIGTAKSLKPPRGRPDPARFVSALDHGATGFV